MLKAKELPQTELKHFAGELARIRDGSFTVDNSVRNDPTIKFRYTTKHPTNGKSVDLVIELDLDKRFANIISKSPYASSSVNTDMGKLVIELNSTRIGYRGSVHFGRWDYMFGHYNMAHKCSFKSDDYKEVDFESFFNQFEEKLFSELDNAQAKHDTQAARNAIRANDKQVKLDKLKATLFQEFGLPVNTKTELGFTIVSKLGSDRKIKAALKEMLPLLV